MKLQHVVNVMAALAVGSWIVLALGALLYLAVSLRG